MPVKKRKETPAEELRRVKEELERVKFHALYFTPKIQPPEPKHGWDYE